MLLIALILIVRHINTLKVIILIGLFTGIMILGFLRFFLSISLGNLFVMYFRILSISILYLLFYSEITPENLTKALMYFKVPYRYAWTISTSFRYIFMLANDSTEIKNALLIRGVPLDGNYIQKIKNIPFVISLLLFRTNYLALKFSEALFAKNWIPYGTKTWLHPLQIKQKQNVLIGLLLIVAIANLGITIISAI